MPDYHDKLVEVRIRFPKPGKGANDSDNQPDYLAIMRERALEKGFIQPTGKTKGEGNINAYILSLVEKDLRKAGKLDKKENIKRSTRRK